MSTPGPSAAVLDFQRSLGSLPHCARVSDDDVQGLYGQAHQAYHLGQHREALRRFQLLLVYRPANPLYLQGAALCLLRLQRHLEAEAAFRFLMLLQPQEPGHPLRCAECQLLMHEDADAEATLAQVMTQCGDDASHSAVRRRAQGLMEFIRTRQAAPLAPADLPQAETESHP